MGVRVLSGAQMMSYYYVSISYATFLLIVKFNIVIDTAPIARKSIGRNINSVLSYYKNRFNATIIKID